VIAPNLARLLRELDALPATAVSLGTGWEFLAEFEGCST
jgi:hypothetical protein